MILLKPLALLFYYYCYEGIFYPLIDPVRISSGIFLRTSSSPPKLANDANPPAPPLPPPKFPRRDYKIFPEPLPLFEVLLLLLLFWLLAPPAALPSKAAKGFEA